jgi:hypothetical protein
VCPKCVGPVAIEGAPERARTEVARAGLGEVAARIPKIDTTITPTTTIGKILRAFVKSPPPPESKPAIKTRGQRELRPRSGALTRNEVQSHFIG